MNNDQYRYLCKEHLDCKSLSDEAAIEAMSRERKAAIFAVISLASSIALITKWDMLPIAVQTAGLFVDSASSVGLIHNIRMMNYLTARQAKLEALAKQLEHQMKMCELASEEAHIKRRKL